MQVVMFYHSLISDWNHGNAHFLRGVATELRARGHDVQIYEPAQGWSRINLLKHYGSLAEERFYATFPGLKSHLYELETLDLDEVLERADLVLVHEWTDPELVARLGEKRAQGGRFRLFFHDTHHRIVSAPEQMERFELDGFDGVLAFGEVIRQGYLRRGWARRAWTWHEAADTRVFKPLSASQERRQLVWIGNWGDDERKEELEEFLFRPVHELGLSATLYGVRYPKEAKRRLKEVGIDHRGWAPNAEVPQIFAHHKVTVHVPRRPYREALWGIPTIRVFEALACEIPLVCAPWRDEEGLFEVGRDFLMVNDGAQMKAALRDLLNDPARAEELAAHGRKTILDRHTCAHRVDELLAIYDEVMGTDPQPRPAKRAGLG